MTQSKTDVENGIKEQIVSKEFEFPLSEAEKDLKVCELKFHKSEEAREEADFEEKKNSYKAAVLRHKNNYDRTFNILDARKELRTVACTMVSDFNTGTIRYLFKDQLMDERPMTDAERQTEMGPVLVKKDAAEIQPNAYHDTSEAAEIKNAIMQETNRHTKSSSVDGPTT